ncbi:class I SAM-dependent methyltransferase [Micromonospora hortensis]|uniref:class I SAM-dependent methyltransferase n=1 Tax=Micromonospora hortensis TaxID=2911209 RepID=UPI001EE91B0F|nr:methyltransferase domain-containing protein [Micromonospora hortensis]MCG5450980.1 methyltransferase domain-containing protein [Micromonospora hortensis]
MTMPSKPASERGHSAPPLADEFDELFRSEAHNGKGFARVVRMVDPAMPSEIEPFSFLSANLLFHIRQQLAIDEGGIFADLGCGRGGPGLWLARTTGATLVGIDFSPVATTLARQRAATFGMQANAHFVVADLSATGLADHAVTSAISVDALQYASDRTAAAVEARRILRPGGRLILTGWHPRQAGDSRLPERHRFSDWPGALTHAGFVDVECTERPDWTEVYLRIYRTALDLGDPAGDRALEGLQAEARSRLPTAHLLHRVLVTAAAGWPHRGALR